MALTTLIVCEAGDEKRQQIEELVNENPDMQLLGAVSRHDAGKEISQRSPRLVWIELAPEPMKALTLLGDLREQHPKVHFLVSNETLDASLVKTSMQLGAADFLDAQTWRVQMPDVIKRIMAKEPAAPTPATAPTEKRSLFGKKPTAEVKTPEAASAAQPAPATAQPAAQSSKWGDLDSIGTPGAKAAPAEPASSEAPAQTSKWGDLDSIGTPGAKAAPTEPASSESPAQTSKWGDLDSIGTPGAKAAAEQPGATAPPAPPAEAGGSKWGNLDAIGTPQAKSPAEPKAESKPEPRGEQRSGSKPEPTASESQGTQQVTDYRTKSSEGASGQGQAPAWIWGVIFGLGLLAFLSFQFYR
ncbi:MAG TPA: hypothetical protein V6D17_01745 [Candidatus Obscuribacterales bacterium]